MRAWGRIGVTALLALWLAGCQSTAYLAHVAHGQWQMVSQRQSVERLQNNPDTPADLKRRLEALQRIRTFAGTLGLPVKGQFDTYVDIRRDYALWSVSATPELSLQAKSWCYWVVGCLAFRNYFDEAKAEAFAAELRGQGYDTYVGKVAAYSTVGWFRDSILSSTIRKREAELAELVFHELAHQVVYAPGDPVFNESFAEVVAHEGLKRYLVSHPEDLERILLRQKRYSEFAQLVLAYRAQLQSLYQSPLTEEEKRQRKMAILSSLREAYQVMKATRWDGYAAYDAWFADLNNARLNSVAVYNASIPALEAILAAGGNDLPAFYTRCRALAELDKAARDRILQQSGPTVELLHD